MMEDALLIKGEETIRLGSRSFAAAARLFDRETRRDAVMLYAWCRYCDDVIDGQTLGHAQRPDFRRAQGVRLARLRQETAHALSGGRAVNANFEALRQVVERRRIPARYPRELLRGFEMDVERRVYRTMTDTLDYCYHVAGVVGIMMAMIMGVRDARALDRASDLGIAFQLTNIARDVIEDAAVGRVYLPEDLLRKHGITNIDARDHAQRKALHAAALELLDVAEPYYGSSRGGLGALPPRSAWAVAAARLIYRDIGRRLRALGPAAWHSRLATGDARKALLLAASVGDVVRSRFAIEDATRPGLWSRPP